MSSKKRPLGSDQSVDETANHSDVEDSHLPGEQETVRIAEATAQPMLVGSEVDYNTPSRQRRVASSETYISGGTGVRPDVVQYVQVPKSTVNHSYRNFSNIGTADPEYSLPEALSQMTFHEKIYALLSSTKSDNREAIRWCRGGRASEISHTAMLSRQGSAVL